jgi:hypothetical protein
MLNGTAISWRSRRPPTVALSSAEAECSSASAMVQEVIFLRKFLGNLGFSQTVPTPVFADNETRIASPGLRALLVAANALNMRISVCTLSMRRGASCYSRVIRLIANLMVPTSSPKLPRLLTFNVIVQLRRRICHGLLEPALLPLGRGHMKISDVEASESGRGRAGDSD